MFWKKSAKSSDLTISGKFSLGNVAPSSATSSPLKTGVLQSGVQPLVPSNSDFSQLDAAPGASHENGQGRGASASIPTSSLRPKAHISAKGGAATYVVPKGYKIASATFVQGLVRVDGELGGRSVAASAIEISAGGAVSAPLEAGFLKVAGQLNAPAEVRGCVELLASAVVTGPVVSAELAVEPGAYVAASRLQVG